MHCNATTIIGRSPVQVPASAPEFPTCFFSSSSLFHFPDPPKTWEHLGARSQRLWLPHVFVTQVSRAWQRYDPQIASAVSNAIPQCEAQSKNTQKERHVGRSSKSFGFARIGIDARLFRLRSRNVPADIGSQSQHELEPPVQQHTADHGVRNIVAIGPGDRRSRRHRRRTEIIDCHFSACRPRSIRRDIRRTGEQQPQGGDHRRRQTLYRQRSLEHH
jgi:hypothetical protein